MLSLFVWPVQQPKLLQYLPKVKVLTVALPVAAFTDATFGITRQATFGIKANLIRPVLWIKLSDFTPVVHHGPRYE